MFSFRDCVCRLRKNIDPHRQPHMPHGSWKQTRDIRSTVAVSRLPELQAQSPPTIVFAVTASGRQLPDVPSPNKADMRSREQDCDTTSCDWASPLYAATWSKPTRGTPLVVVRNLCVPLPDARALKPPVRCALRASYATHAAGSAV